jgi:hypothetical protein
MKKKLLPYVSFHHDLHLMVFRPTGIVDEPHVEKTVAMLEKVEEETDQPFNRYTDLSKIDAIDLRFEFIFRISLHRRLVRAKQPPVKSAIYVTSPATARVARTHVLLTDRSPLQVRMFKAASEAADWLGVTVEDLELAP